jgi:hypothetical protein
VTGRLRERLGRLERHPAPAGRRLAEMSDVELDAALLRELAAAGIGLDALAKGEIVRRPAGAATVHHLQAGPGAPR